MFTEITTVNPPFSLQGCPQILNHDRNSVYMIDSSVYMIDSSDKSFVHNTIFKSKCYKITHILLKFENWFRKDFEQDVQSLEYSVQPERSNQNPALPLQ